MRKKKSFFKKFILSFVLVLDLLVLDLLLRGKVLVEMEEVMVFTLSDLRQVEQKLVQNF